MASGLTEAQIRQRPPTGKWSIFENMARLGRYQAVFLDRIQRIIAEETPRFSRYAADDDPAFVDWRNLSFLTPLYGPMTIEGWTEFVLLHEAHHLLTTLRLGGSLRTAEQPMGL